MIWVSIGIKNILDYLYRHLSFNSKRYKRASLAIPNDDEGIIDEQVGINSFHRTQYFAHEKGFYVLNQIREVIGSSTFD